MFDPMLEMKDGRAVMPEGPGWGGAHQAGLAGGGQSADHAGVKPTLAFAYGGLG